MGRLVIFLLLPENIVICLFKVLVVLGILFQTIINYYSITSSRIVVFSHPMKVGLYLFHKMKNIFSYPRRYRLAMDESIVCGFSPP